MTFLLNKEKVLTGVMVLSRSPLTDDFVPPLTDWTGWWEASLLPCLQQLLISRLSGEACPKV
jgi:hypothetical protein